jgi:hypothetical protein
MVYLIEISLLQPRNSTAIRRTFSKHPRTNAGAETDEAARKENQKRQICKKNCILKIRARAEPPADSS